MNDKFKTFVGTLLSEDDASYTASVETSIILALSNDFDYESPQNVTVRFALNITARSWGIGGISASIHYVEPMQVEIQNVRTGQVVKTIQIEVDPTKIQIDKVAPTNYIGLTEMAIYASENGEVDYSKSYIQSAEL